MHAVHAGAYAVGHPLLLRHARYMAAVLACGDGALLSHRSAGALWGLTSTPSRDVEVLVHRAGGRRHRGILVHTTRSLDEADIAVEEGIACTSVHRTLADLAAVLTGRQLRRSLERSVELRLYDHTAMEATLARARGRRGIRALRQMLPDVSGEPAPTTSELERRFLGLVRKEGLAIPVVNAYVCGYQVDFHWPAHRLIVETDGRATHDTPHQFEEDRRRDLELAADGWQVIRLTWRQVVHRPARVAAVLRARLRRNGPP